MKFSLFFEMQINGPTRAKEIAIFQESVKQAILADKLGYYCIWAVEHHGLYEYSHSSAPEIFLSFVAAQTRNIRVGHGCTLLPRRYNHPIRIAERIATLDILSNGRVNWGTAKSKTFVERGAFQIDATTIHREWREAIEMIPQMWCADVYSYKGEFFDIPPTAIIPKPIQSPHPPIFAACSRPEQAAEIGLLGVGALNLAMHRDEKLAAHVRAYRQAVENATPVGAAITNHFACNPAALVLKDDHKACELGLQGARFFLQAMLHYGAENRPTGPTNATREPPAQEDLELFRNSRNTAASQLSSIIGDPKAAAETVQRFVDAGVDELILVMQTGTTPHEIVTESIRTFGEEVIPLFA